MTLSSAITYNISFPGFMSPDITEVIKEDKRWNSICRTGTKTMLSGLEAI